MTDAPERIWIYHHSDQYENPVSPHMPTVGCLDDYTSYVRDDLYAALEAENARLRADLARPRVKSLVWQGCESDCYITAEMGNYHYEAGVVDLLERACDYVWEARYCVVGEDDLQLGIGAFEDVKAAAQAHYDAQILACLEGGSDEGGTPPVDIAAPYTALRAEVERLREALRKIATTYKADQNRLIHSEGQIIGIARAALQSGSRDND